MTKKEYVTVRIPKVFDDLINKYIEEHKEEMMLLYQRASRLASSKGPYTNFLRKRASSRKHGTPLKSKEKHQSLTIFRFTLKKLFWRTPS